MGPLGVLPAHPPELQVSQVLPWVAKFKRYRLPAWGIIGLELRPHLSSRLRLFSRACGFYLLWFCEYERLQLNCLPIVSQYDDCPFQLLDLRGNDRQANLS